MEAVRVQPGRSDRAARCSPVGPGRCRGPCTQPGRVESANRLFPQRSSGRSARSVLPTSADRSLGWNGSCRSKGQGDRRLVSNSGPGAGLRRPPSFQGAMLRQPHAALGTAGPSRVRTRCHDAAPSGSIFLRSSGRNERRCLLPGSVLSCDGNAPTRCSQVGPVRSARSIRPTRGLHDRISLEPALLASLIPSSPCLPRAPTPANASSTLAASPRSGPSLWVHAGWVVSPSRRVLSGRGLPNRSGFEAVVVWVSSPAAPSFQPSIVAGVRRFHGLCGSRRLALVFSAVLLFSTMPGCVFWLIKPLDTGSYLARQV